MGIGMGRGLDCCRKHWLDVLGWRGEESAADLAQQLLTFSLEDPSSSFPSAQLGPATLATEGEEK